MYVDALTAIIVIVTVYAAGSVVTYWLLTQGRALAQRHQPRQEHGAVAAIPVTQAMAACPQSEMGGPVWEQARLYKDWQSSDASMQVPEEIVFPMGDRERILVKTRQLSRFLCLRDPVRSRRMPDGSMSPGYRGDAVTYSTLLKVARAYGWVREKGARGVEWSDDYRSFRLRIIRVQERNHITLPPPGSEDVALPGA